MYFPFVSVNVCNQRTGSKFLGSCLRSGGEVVSLGEIFNPNHGQALTFYSWLADYVGRPFRGRLSWDMLDTFFSALYAQFGPVHFDLMYNQINGLSRIWQDEYGLDILKYFDSRGFFIIHTVRRPAEIFLSIKRLEATGIPHLRPEEQIDIGHTETAIALDMDEFCRFEENYRKWRSAVAEALDGCRRYLELKFDDLTANGGYLPQNVQDFFRVGLRESGVSDGNFVQGKAADFGKAPKSMVRFSNEDQILNHSSC